MIQHDDLLALQLVEAALLGSDVIDDAGAFAVGIEKQREHIGENASVRGIGAAVIDGDERHLVLGDAVDHGVGDADRERIPGRDAGIALEALIDLDALLHLILRLPFRPGQLDAVHAAVTGGYEVQVVDEPAEEAGAAGCVGSDTRALQGKMLFVGMDGGGADRDRSRQSSPFQGPEESHECVSCFPISLGSC